MKGKIVLIPFPFTDLTSTKLRPALVLHEGDADIIVAFISSKLPKKPSPSDVIITERNPEYAPTGLKVSSVIKLDKVATLSREMVLGEIGELGPILRREVNRKISRMYKL